MVSCGEIVSYDFTPFRPFIAECLLDVGAMRDEYVGIIPTNAEATLLAIATLMSYAYYVLGVPPNQLLL